MAALGVDAGDYWRLRERVRRDPDDLEAGRAAAAAAIARVRELCDAHCPECGTQLPSGANRGGRKYCGKACVRRAKARKAKSR